MFHHWLVCHGNHGFRQIVGQRPESCPEAPCHYYSLHSASSLTYCLKERIIYTERHNFAYLRCLGLLCSDALYAHLFMTLCIESGLLHAILSINILSVKDKENILQKYLAN